MRAFDLLKNTTWFTNSRFAETGLFDRERRQHLVDLGVRLSEELIHGGKWDGSFIGKGARLQWDSNLWKLDELPQKGKRKVREASMHNPHGMVRHRYNLYYPDNVLHFAKLSNSDDYDTIKRKILVGMEKDFERFRKSAEEYDKYAAKSEKWLTAYSWDEREISSLLMAPENADPLTIHGKDFVLKSSWREFSTASPNSDFQALDPSYTMYGQKSKTAARKLYLILKANPGVLKNISWHQLGKRFDSKKVAYKTHFSVYR